LRSPLAPGTTLKTSSEEDLEALGIYCIYCNNLCHPDQIVSCVIGHYSISLESLDEEDDFEPTLVGTFCSYEHLAMHFKNKFFDTNQELLGSILNLIL
jgi:hypothetical protein